jgi:putative aldouronate transport system permease protein
LPHNAVSTQQGSPPRRTSTLLRDVRASKYIYLMVLPGLAFYIIFLYIPIYGITLAFKDYSYALGILKSPWNGLHNFVEIMAEPQFGRAVRNTIIISFGRILTGFPVPILLALLLNEVRSRGYQRGLQTLYTFPHFLSWVILAGILTNLLNSSGTVNNFLVAVGGRKYNFLADPSLFRPLLFATGIWKESGWESIIYLAAMAAIDPALYEAATVDGANRAQRMLHITWPGIKAVVFLLLVLAVGNAMNAGFDQIFNLYNPVVFDKGDIIDTYVYRITFLRSPDYGMSTAVGVFKAGVNLLLLVAADRSAKALGQSGIF